jgi:hypothetical protein
VENLFLPFEEGGPDTQAAFDRKLASLVDLPGQYSNLTGQLEQLHKLVTICYRWDEASGLECGWRPTR